MLQVNNLFAKADSASILQDLSLVIKAGEVVALMGPNGSGKSTLAHILAGHPSYEVTGGSVQFLGEDLLTLSPEERASKGIFLAFQYPASIPGVPISQFLRLTLNAQGVARGEAALGVAEFIKLLRPHLKTLNIEAGFVERAVNDGFSGGEKKRLEMLQMLVLQPKLIILDEIDSGLDVDAMKVVSEAVNQLIVSGSSVLVITHYQRLLNYIKPGRVYIAKKGAITTEGGPELVEQLEEHGYVNL